MSDLIETLELMCEQNERQQIPRSFLVDLRDEIERLKARVAELESALRGYVKATTGQESATVTFPMALEGEVK